MTAAAPEKKTAEPPFAETGTVDADEVARFSAMADAWWDPTGKFRPLHKINPVRLAYIRDTVTRQLRRDAKADKPLKGLKLLDIGCGGGLLSEPMARLGATVVGADPSRNNIETARVHAERSGVEIDYRQTTAEDIAAGGEKFDVILNMEVVEHVADVDLFLKTCADLLKPGGIMTVATLNRTLKAYALAIVGAEYILRWLPRGTHQWEKFLKPAELQASLEAAGLEVIDRSGIVFDPLRDQWNASPDMSVNYMLATQKPME
ncbi:bifunctional 2-polyprenyl-6-hydroxyphenol methylase/3-demethylubiquinol 3-O-methyltransferase UbiG [Rhodobium gokarnense]|uniref:Ubiquinone biosynthesis O-methyltransferase n=1 Tax=Rhodobium gokarnense TaxID=364296 RepID=A0ABT3H8R9_9HYPH|nr:bifunctional 2-polyprenyl-6-hydroxyphenol methylase/3-demethylubiquinol 3-O-methyltransferase UbiG [Rhodobium gokarnense]MCW2306791.1 2-polyprenyl-6-hydroxyphenyl methylase/3-demethylubiquinone-9 3-methyltransferase [Rhodobium gokarnense]